MSARKTSDGEHDVSASRKHFHLMHPTDPTENGSLTLSVPVSPRLPLRFASPHQGCRESGTMHSIRS